MMSYRSRWGSLSRILALASLLFAARVSRGQDVPHDRIGAAVRDSEVQQIHGNVHPLAQAQFDRGKVADSAVLPRITMFFAPSSSQQAALSQFLSEQQDRSSPNYHLWITPQEFGTRFGLSQNDLGKVVSWLESHGFAVQDIPASRNAVSFSGSASQVAAAFQTSIHRYVRNGESHYANSVEPSVPAALAGVISGVAGLNDFRPMPRAIRRAASSAKPDFTDGTTTHFLAPADFAAIYDVQPLYGRGINGSGQKIAVVGQSDIQLGDIREFRSLMGLPANDPQIVLVPGSADPGMQNGDLQEADLDLEWAGAVAQDAALIYVNSTNAWDSLQYAITNDVAPVISVSYGACEPLFSRSDVQYFMLVGQQANAQGQTIIVSSGDSGAANCDDLLEPRATQGLAVSMPASLPYVTAVGGTEFSEGSGTYWNTTNDSNNGSAFSYIPEISWNDSLAGYEIEATGGGASTLFTKPFWQSGIGVPNDGVRDLPDISLSASASHDSYLICDETFNATANTFTPVCPTGSFGGFAAVGGTSASAPVFAGIVALLNQSMNSPQGNINYLLYRLASLSPNALHDITSGSNAVPCQTNPASPDCVTGGSGAGFLGYLAGPGYDMATGLGSVDANVLISAWPSVTLPPDFDISVSPAKITLNRGQTATAEITINNVGGLTGSASLACNVPAIFLGVTCSIASKGPNVFTLTLTTSNNAAALFPMTSPQTGARFAAPIGAPVHQRSGIAGARPPLLGIFSYTSGAGSYPFAVCLLMGGIAVWWCARQSASGRARLAGIFGVACSVAALLGCAGATSSGNGGSNASAQLVNASDSLQLTPKSAVLGASTQQQFTATMGKSSSISVNWSLSPALGSITPAANSGGSAIAFYAAPSGFSANQSLTITATSVADPTKQASANILLVAAQSGAIQVTGSVSGVSHTLAISLNVN
jgi:pro-kumamolisin-like protein/subtilase family protein